VRTCLLDDHGNAKRYQMSPVADFYRAKMEEARMDDAYNQFLESQRLLEDGIEKIESVPIDMDHHKMREIDLKHLLDEDY